jgi:phospholipid transport system substrate-binding protein
MRARNGLFLLLSVIFITHSGIAQAADPATGFIDGVGREVLAVLKDKTSGDSAKDARLRALFERSVDVPWIGRFVLGKYWRTATEAQRARYLNGYRVFVVKSYTSKFQEYTGSETYKILSSKPDGAGRYLVTMELLRGAQPSVLVDYKLREEAGNLRIYDIVVEGVSLLTTQRSEFASVVSRKGLDYLIERIEARARG